MENKTGCMSVRIVLESQAIIKEYLTSRHLSCIKWYHLPVHIKQGCVFVYVSKFVCEGAQKTIMNSQGRSIEFNSFL